MSHGCRYQRLLHWGMGSAVSISRRKDVPIPRDALINRYTMCDFIARHVGK